MTKYKVIIEDMKGGNKTTTECKDVNQARLFADLHRACGIFKITIKEELLCQ